MSFAAARAIQQHELMDAADVEPAALRRALSFIRLVNRLLRYNAATVRALEQMVASGTTREPPSGAASLEHSEEKPCSGSALAETAPPANGISHGFSSARTLASGEAVPLTLLDVATGSADLPQEIGRWAKRRRTNIRCVGLDLHPLTLAIAQEWAPEVPLVRGDALRLPFADASFDFATCGMFLHHLPTESAVQVLREMERITRRGWIVADLLRRRRALAWISLFTLFAGKLERHDARVSVKQAFTPAEARQLAIDAGPEAHYREVFGHRFLLVRDKSRI